MTNARFWQLQAETKAIKCNLCPRYCVILPGKRGFCKVRINRNNNLETLAFGKISGINIDPIEKKPLYHFLPGTPILSFGTASCNLGCVFCQNWEMTKNAPDETLTLEVSPESLITAASENLCPSIAFTYNDPVVSAEFTIEVANKCRLAGIKTVLVSAGYVSVEARQEFFAAADAANIDLKGFTEDFYKNYCNASLAPILDNLKYIVDHTNLWLEITNLIIPGANDSLESLDKMTMWIAENLGDYIPLHFSAFHPAYKAQNMERTRPETLLKAYEIAKRNGLKYVYLGNIQTTNGANTYCHHCHKVLIERSHFKMVSCHIVNGRCKHCKEQIPGFFDPLYLSPHSLSEACF